MVQGFPFTAWTHKARIADIWIHRPIFANNLLGETSRGAGRVCCMASRGFSFNGNSIYTHTYAINRSVVFHIPKSGISSFFCMFNITNYYANLPNNHYTPPPRLLQMRPSSLCLSNIHSTLMHSQDFVGV